jgi:hypothetical protein
MEGGVWLIGIVFKRTEMGNLGIYVYVCCFKEIERVFR